MACRAGFAAAKYRKVVEKPMQAVRRFAVYCREITKEDLTVGLFSADSPNLFSFAGVIKTLLTGLAFYKTGQVLKKEPELFIFSPSKSST